MACEPLEYGAPHEFILAVIYCETYSGREHLIDNHIVLL